eukprot:Gregarina_sp_Poly_1__1308@NODE_1321_length_4393_cov_152_206657_g597_i2_p3_GENE_NODE_1321_length_4393_cov_152_206657_g597_i2NODE_1321_length_4393_cov_152_206657_g597_i2_p3_ORF_typecomplete_len303_score26_78CoA_binding_3/PF13727_6/3_2p53inducible11/PF14936_6/8_5p53inducible11/PF14936_6/6_2e02_NODE_1321_length_4393_cov_152_206657_g597_i230233931
MKPFPYFALIVQMGLVAGTGSSQFLWKAPTNFKAQITALYRSIGAQAFLLTFFFSYFYWQPHNAYLLYSFGFLLAFFVATASRILYTLTLGTARRMGVANIVHVSLIMSSAILLLGHAICIWSGCTLGTTVTIISCYSAGLLTGIVITYLRLKDSDTIKEVIQQTTQTESQESIRDQETKQESSDEIVNLYGLNTDSFEETSPPETQFHWNMVTFASAAMECLVFPGLISTQCRFRMSMVWWFWAHMAGRWLSVAAALVPKHVITFCGLGGQGVGSVITMALIIAGSRTKLFFLGIILAGLG